MRRDSERISFSIDFDRPARHRFGNGLTNLRQFAAERGDRLLDPVRTLQLFDLARNLGEMALEHGEIRARRHCRRNRRCHCGRDRRRADRRHRPRRGAIEFALARSDFRDRKLERRRVERRGGTVDLRGGALDHIGQAPILKRGLSRGRIRNLRQARIEARDGIIQLPGDGGLAAQRLAARRIVARPGLRHLLDLAGD